MVFALAAPWLKALVTQMTRSLNVRSERWPLREPFRISRGVKEAAEVVVVEARDGEFIGVGEAVPYARYGESVDGVRAAAATVADVFSAGLERAQLQLLLPAGAARNAVDCALWDLEAKRSGRDAAAIAGLNAPRELISAVTISLDEAERMAVAAAAAADAPLLKVKVNADNPVGRIAAVRAVAPNARLIVDANESWTPGLLEEWLPEMAALDVALIEQPLPAGDDGSLATIKSPVPICADEAAHVTADLNRLSLRYQCVNIKLDKAGGLTEALVMRRRAVELGLKVMIGCMICTSLSIAPALLLADGADFVDLDGPWWLRQDREAGVRFARGRMTAPAAGWGYP
jgi:L-alanine-DL-glutamate epimerase-like enolase superfamily enzyme